MSIGSVTINATYTMTVVATLGAGGTSEPSLPLDVTIPDLSAPSIPQNLSATAITDSSFILDWDTCTDNVGVTRYEIFMDGESIGNTGTNTLPVPYLTPGTTYTMAVRSVDAAGNVSELSAPLDVTTQNSTGASADLRSARAAHFGRIRLTGGDAVWWVSLGSAAGDQALTVSIVDLRGRTLARWDNVRAGQTIDIGDLPRSVGIIDMQGAGTNRRLKLLHR
jgi:hypothetical protein